MYEFRYDSNMIMKTQEKILFTLGQYLMNEIKTEDIYEAFSMNKEIFVFSNYITKPKYYDNSNKLLLIKWKVEFVGLMPKMYSILVDDSSDHNKAKGANKSVIAVISHGEW